MKMKYIQDIKGLKIILIIGVASLLIHLLLRSSIPGSALLYVGIPFLIAVLLTTFTKRIEEPNWKQQYWNALRNSLIIMLGSSIILFEGFLCVVMFMPIYFGILLLVFIATYLFRKSDKKSTLSAHIIPVLIVLSAFEGTHSDLSFNRYNEVSVTQTIQATPKEIKQNLIRPIDLQQDRNWFLALFPMPYQVDSGTLEAGDIHKIYYRYHRWFVTNTHEGYTLLKIAQVKDNYIRTEFMEDTSYISHYMKLLGTEIHLQPINNTSTEVTLKIQFERKLDPIWYFQPLQRYGVKKTADYLITEMME